MPPEKKGQDGIWQRHPDQWRWVLWIFEQVAVGKGGDTVAAMLNARGVPPPRGDTWNAAAIRRIVRRTAYIGQLKRRMEDQEFIFAVPAIVPPDLFALANAQIDGNHKASPRNAKHEYLFSATQDEPLLCCRICHTTLGKDYLMGGRCKPRPEHTKGWLHYRCNNSRGIDHSVSAQQIEQAVWDALVALLTDPALVLENIRKLSDAASAQSRDLQQELAGLQERAGEIRAAQVRLAEASAWGKLPADILENQAAALEEEAQAIAGQISLGHVQLEHARAGTVPIRDINDACALLREGAEGATFEERRWIVRTLVDRIYADKKGWVLSGRLPSLHAQGVLGAAAAPAIGEQRSSPSDGRWAHAACGGTVPPRRRAPWSLRRGWCWRQAPDVRPGRAVTTARSVVSLRPSSAGV